MEREEFQSYLNQVNQSYFNRKEKQVWKGYNKEVRELTDIVGREFQKVLDEIEPVVSLWIERYNKNTAKAIVKRFNIGYNPEQEKFTIKIHEIKTTDGEPIESPHSFLGLITGFDDGLHPKIKEFKEKYNVDDIRNPSNNCEHK